MGRNHSIKYTCNVVQGKQGKQSTSSRHDQFVLRTQIYIVGILIVLLLTLCGSSMTAPAPQGACTVEQPQVELVV